DQGVVAVVEQLEAPAVGFVAIVERADANVDEIVHGIASGTHSIPAFAQRAGQHFSVLLVGDGGNLHYEWNRRRKCRMHGRRGGGSRPSRWLGGGRANLELSGRGRRRIGSRVGRR